MKLLVNDAAAAAALKLAFFGARYVTTLLIAAKMGAEATVALLVWGLVEITRVVFDFGLESTLLTLRKSASNSEYSFLWGAQVLRVALTIIGQVVISSAAMLISFDRNVDYRLPLIISFQFSGIMAFGYLLANAQQKGGSMLTKPLPFIIILGVLQVGLAMSSLPPEAYSITFETLSSLIMLIFHRRLVRLRSNSEPKREILHGVLHKIWPLGGAAIIGICYARLDTLILPFLMDAHVSQYVLFQRIASAPLMLFSVGGSVAIPAMSRSYAEFSDLRKTRHIQRAFAIGIGGLAALLMATVAIGYLVRSALITSYPIYAFQMLALLMQVSNGFSTAKLIARNRTTQVFGISCRSALLGSILLPPLSWLAGPWGLAMGVCLCESFTALQHYWIRKQVVQ